MEYKQLRLDAAEVKFNDEERTIEGYASVFGGVDSYGDTIAKGAYEKTLEERQRPVRMRWNHFGPVIGKWLKMREDEKGLYVKGTLTPGHSVADDVYASLKHGAVDGLSIGFIPKAYEMDEENEMRTLTEIELIEISVVEEPADLGARIDEVKNLNERINEIETLKDAEACLRDACGVSRSAAKAMVSQIKTLVQRDAVPETDSGEAVEADHLNWRLYKALKLQTN
jgi:HK97 family phage prohead protease